MATDATRGSSAGSTDENSVWSSIAVQHQTTGWDANIRQPTLKTFAPSLGLDFFEKAGAVHKQLDADKDGYLSDAEIGGAVESGRYKGRDAQVVAALYSTKADLARASNDEYGSENDGITEADLKAFSKDWWITEPDRYYAMQTRKWAEEKFSITDNDSDGYLSKHELELSAVAKKKDHPDQPALRYLLRKFHDLQYKSDDQWWESGMSKKDIEFNSAEIISTDTSRLLLYISETLKRTEEAQDPALPKTLYADMQDPVKSINPEACLQGDLGNCYFLAALAAVAQSNPQSIVDMIRPNGDGTFTVTFPRDRANPITVTAPAEIEMGLFNGASEYGIWASVLEKAYGEYKQQQFWWRQGYTSAEGSDGGGIGRDALEFLTGRKTDMDDMRRTPRTTVELHLYEAFQDGRAVICRAEQREGQSYKTVDGFHRNHTHSIIGYDPKGPDGGTVTVRNPWGEEEGTPIGTVQLKQFRVNFDHVFYQKSN